MGRILDAIDDDLAAWIGRQPVFFVGSAPLAGDGHVNVSPKGPIGTLAVLGPHEVAYLDLTGSSAETFAHLRENGRILIMLCAFEGPPKIIRLHGRGEAYVPGDERFDALAAHFDAPGPPEARRAIVRVEVTRIAKSCGYSVPLLAPAGEREHMPRWAEKRLRTGGPHALAAYRAEKNAVSIDGLTSVG